MPTYEVINSEAHLNLRLNPKGGYAFAADQHIVSVVLHEFSHVALSYPIVFVKNGESASFRPMALLGLEIGKNLFVDPEGRWLSGAYVPAAFRRYPFALTDNGQGSFAICFDSSSPFIDTAEGERLFNDQGEVTNTMESVTTFLKDLMSSEVAAGAFCEHLSKLDLLVPCEFKVQQPDGLKTYGGSFMVDEQKLFTLAKEEFLTLRESGFLGPIYAHLLSLLQVNKFSSLRS